MAAQSTLKPFEFLHDFCIIMTQNSEIRFSHILKIDKEKKMILLGHLYIKENHPILYIYEWQTICEW